MPMIQVVFDSQSNYTIDSVSYMTVMGYYITCYLFTQLHAQIHMTHCIPVHTVYSNLLLLLIVHAHFYTGIY